VKQKILLVGWGYPPKIDGGLDIHVRHLFEELLEQGVEVSLALPEERAPDRENVIPVNTGSGDMVQRSRKMSAGIAEIAENFDIVHTHDWFGAESGFKAKKYGDAKWVSTFHSLSSGRNREPGEDLQRLEKVAAEKPDTVLAVSEKLAEEIEDEFGVKPEIVHNGFSKPQNSDIDIRKRHRIPEDENLVFFVGRHAEQKGLEHLLYGFKKLVEEIEATLIIGGEGHMKEALENFTKILGIEEKVVFTGFIPREELGNYYMDSDVFVSPSINEPFGLTITEALESKTPVVATDSGVSEVAGDSIIKAEPESDSIKEGIELALEKEADLEFESRTWSEMAEETIKIYQELSQNG
jgi:glycosyltransferase involved in cell wall biosynthesis